MNAKQVRAAAQAIADAQRPVLYVGGGTINAEACDELRALAELWQLPVVTTLMAKSSFPETHELHFGWPGMHGAKWSNWAMNKCDVLVAVGARFDDRVTGKLSAFAPGATVVHLDVDAAEIGKLRQADIPVVGPLKQILAELASAFEALKAKGVRSQTNPWLAQLAAWREEFPLRYGDDGDLLKPQRVLETLQAQTSGRDDMIWTTGVGQHQMWAMQYLLCDRPRSFITSGGLGTMGYGLPAAVGAKAARPDATVVCVDGDGCFQMTSQELATSVTEDLPIVVVIVNNGYLGMVRQWQDMFFEERFSQVRLAQDSPDYVKLAEAYGAVGLRAETEDELDGALAEALACGRTAVVDCRVDPAEHCFPMIPAGAAALDLVEYEAARGAGPVIHTLSVLVEDKPGALMRISSMFARRGYNIESLAVGPTERRERLADRPARRLRATLARADREADAQARQRPAGERARVRPGGRAGARPDHGRGRAGASAQSCCRSPTCSASAWPTSARTRSCSRSSARPSRSTRSRSSCARTGSRSWPARAGSDWRAHRVGRSESKQLVHN